MTVTCTSVSDGSLEVLPRFTARAKGRIWKRQNDILQTGLRMKAWSFPGGTNGKEPAYQRKRYKRHSFDPWVEKIPWRRKWQLSPVFLPRESHGERSLEGYSPGVAKSCT